MDLYKERERICREIGDMDSLQLSPSNQALILDSRGGMEGAIKWWYGRRNKMVVWKAQ